MYKCPMCGALANLVSTNVFRSAWTKCACAQGHRWETKGEAEEGAEVQLEWNYAEASQSAGTERTFPRLE